MKNHSLILVVDDDSQVRRLLSRCLKRAGYEVVLAETGGEGLELVKRHCPDLALVDVRLPDISGIEVCQQIKNDPGLRDVFVALCSGEETNEIKRVNGFETGADEYFLKPFGLDELLARVKTLIRLRNTTAALRVSEEHHRRLIDILPDAVCLIHPNGRILAVNSQGVNMLGYAATGELLAKTIFQITPAGEHDRIMMEIATALKTGIIRNVECTLLKKDGASFPVELNATVSLGIDNQPAGLLSIVRDITERKQAQSALQASEERFRQLANHIREVFWMSNADKSKIIYVSPAYEEIWGRSCGSLYASPQTWIEAVHPDDRERISEHAAALQISGDYDEIYRIIRPDGSIRWIHDRAFPIRESNGTVHRIVGVADDITKRQQAWDSLRESEARKQAIMQSALDSIVTIDHTGRIIEVNSATEKIFGLNQSKLTGESVVGLIPASFRAWFQNGLACSFVGETGPIQGSRIELPIMRADGSYFPGELVVTRITLGGPPMFTIYIRDITQQKRAEAELRSLPQRIIKAQEAERSRIAQELHDGINQLLASVKMRLRKVENSLPELRPAPREILRRCDNLLVRALEENRRIAHNLRPAELDNLGLAAACGSFCNEVQLRTNLRVQCRLISSTRRLSPMIELNLFRIVQESVNNIVKHAGAKKVKLSMQIRRGLVTLKIQDDGCGFNTKTAQAGGIRAHGLGLTNIRERARSLDGTCEINSEPGAGTIITVTAPIGSVKSVFSLTNPPSPAS
jgi:PAS domain S-box-containing protein